MRESPVWAVVALPFALALLVYAAAALDAVLAGAASATRCTRAYGCSSSSAAARSRPTGS
ncbi:hypothetical protein ACFQHO_33045 [Actinomadura yumaensis]|uniref:hypothetical protein n=1 Tax=Actinomadura yumaensis TaxID=111807 RepID=UPI003611EC9D